MSSFRSYFPKFFILASIKSIFDIIILLLIAFLVVFVITIPLAIPLVLLLWITSLSVYIYVSQMIPTTNQQTISNTNISIRQTIKKAISFSTKENIKAILIWAGITMIGMIMFMISMIMFLGILLAISSYESIFSIIKVPALVIMVLFSIFILSIPWYLTRFYKFLYVSRGSATLALSDMKNSFTKNNMKTHIIGIIVLAGMFTLLSIVLLLIFIFISLIANFIIGVDVIQFLGMTSGRELLVFLLFLPIYFLWYVIYIFSIEFVLLSTTNYYYRKISEQSKV
ncbi:MAG: hypothetical protein N3C61_03160 [Candidatus Micrarchaeota archaeon]|nr:hypothetical protein [Candidatus Micrarchaeota archaeon]